jgi:hypothetical protein
LYRSDTEPGRLVWLTSIIATLVRWNAVFEGALLGVVFARLSSLNWGLWSAASILLASIALVLGPLPGIFTMTANIGGSEEVIGFLNRCQEEEPTTVFVIYRTMNANTVIYKKKIENDALVGVVPEWLMYELLFVWYQVIWLTKH